MRELVDSKDELKAAASDYERMGWEVTDRTAGRIVVERGLRGSWVWHLLYFIAAPIYGNLVYSAYRRYDRPEQVVIRVRGFAADGGRKDTAEEESDDARAG
jgi:hypothetical protein